jgi:hypothetical protein
MSDDEKYIFLNKQDFSQCSWKGEWDQIVDQHGDGVRVLYPAKVKLFLGRSPLNHVCVDG